MIRKAVGAIVFKGNKFLIINKTKINTNQGKENIKGEWDFVKGGVEDKDNSLHDSLLRELKEETGSTEYKVVKQLAEKINFEFSDVIKKKIGYERQETSMFLVEFLGDADKLIPFDNEICNIRFLEKENVLKMLSHLDTKDYFMKHFDC